MDKISQDIKIQPWIGLNMELKKLESKLQLNPFIKKIYYQPEVDSTNLWAARTENVQAGTVFLTDYQTEGYGRLKRQWESPRGKNILMTFIDTPPMNPALTPQLTLVTGVAFAKALKELGVNITLKWPNDLFVNKKKCGGIICESSGNLVRIGVGLNINSTPADFSQAVKELSTSTFRELGKELNREDVVAHCLNQYEKTRHTYDIKGIAEIIKEWQTLTFPLQTPMRLIEDNKITEGTYQGVSPDGYLQLQVGNRIEQFMSGDLHVTGD